MKLDPETTRPTITRLKRAHGHLASVIRMLEEGADCEDVLTQLAAVNKAIGRGGFSLVSTGLQQCLAENGPDSTAAKRMEKLFLSLA